jgi:hypothetical protein
MVTIMNDELEVGKDKNENGDDGRRKSTEDSGEKRWSVDDLIAEA